MKIATYNVNGINARLPVLLGWLEQAKPDVVCLQELKASQEKIPAAAIAEAGYGAIWHGQKSWNGVAILARDTQPREIRRDLPGDSDDAQSRYIEAEIYGLRIGCLYLPNGNPAPGPKLAYKMSWLERLIKHAAELIRMDIPVVLAGDSDGNRRRQARTMARGCLVSARSASGVSPVGGAELDGCAAENPPPRSAIVHLLGLLSLFLRTQCRTAY